MRVATDGDPAELPLRIVMATIVAQKAAAPTMASLPAGPSLEPVEVIHKSTASVIIATPAARRALYR
jgi:hypothetical protein